MFFFCDTCGEKRKGIEDRSAGEVMCEQCGEILSNQWVDETAEYRVFDEDDNEVEASEKRKRVGGPIKADGGLEATVISKKDCNKKKVTVNRGILHQHLSLSVSSEDRSMMNAKKEIAVISKMVDLDEEDEVIERACQIFRKLVDKKLLKGKSSKVLAAACLYFACKEERLGRTIKQFCKSAEVEVQVFNKAHKVVEEAMQLHSIAPNSNTEMQTLRICSSLEFAHQDKKNVGDIVKKIEADGVLLGRKPASIIGVSIYIVSYLSGAQLDFQKIADACDVTESTIRRAYSDLYPTVATLLPPDWKPAVPVAQLPVPTAYKK